MIFAKCYQQKKTTLEEKHNSVTIVLELSDSECQFSKLERAITRHKYFCTHYVYAHTHKLNRVCTTTGHSRLTGALLDQFFFKAHTHNEQRRHQMDRHTHTQINIKSSSSNLAVKVTAVSWVSVITGPAEKMSFQIPTVSICVCTPLNLQVRKHTKSLTTALTAKLSDTQSTTTTRLKRHVKQETSLQLTCRMMGCQVEVSLSVLLSPLSSSKSYLSLTHLPQLFYRVCQVLSDLLSSVKVPSVTGSPKAQQEKVSETLTRHTNHQSQ